MTTVQRAERLARFRSQMTDTARGEHLRRLRHERGLSQEIAAHEAGFSTKALRDWEHDGGIRPQNAERLAEFYEVEIESIVNRALPSTLELSDVQAMAEHIATMAASLSALEPLVQELVQRFRRHSANSDGC